MIFRPITGVRSLFCIGSVFVFMGMQTLIAAEQEGATAQETPAPSLSATQEAIEMRYRRFEGTLMQLSEYLRKTDPARAELLLRASGKSKEGRIPDQLQNLTDLLKRDQLGDAVERQELVVVELQSLLQLLMSEARKDDLEQEKRRIQDLIKDVNKLIGKETEARANTERGANNAELQSQQKQVADSTKKLVEKIESQDLAKKSDKKDASSDPAKNPKESNDKDPPKDQSDSKDPPPSKDNENPEGKSSDKPDGKSDGEKKPGESQSKPGDPQDSKTDKPKSEKEGDSQKPDDSQKDPSKSEDNPKEKSDSSSENPQKSKPQSGKPQNSKPQKGKPQEGDQPQDKQDGQDQQDQQEQSPQEQDQQKPDKTPGREELERAKQEMDRAIEELKKNNKKNASDKQDKAIAELMKAKEKLEEILRQLREEERELVLAQMEARFRDMLQKQETVNTATLAIDTIPADSRTDRHRNRAVELARNEDEISLLAAKGLTLLKEEGSSVAFPEAVEQIREDMLTVARRLERVDVGEITQNIEQDIVEGLKEIIEALQKELEKLKDKKQQQQQQDQEQQQQQKQQQGLVNKLAELKMLRSLQYRVNRRTKQLGRLVEGEQALDVDVVSQLRQLSDRQSKVQKATYDLATGKNQ